MLGKGPTIPADMTFLDLDSNATTPLHPAAWEAMRSLMLDNSGNASSAHALGRKARRQLETAREEVAALLGAKAEEVIFTSGATEANNLAIFGLVGPTTGTISAAPFEHPCVIEPLKALEKRGFAVNWLPVTPTGTVEQREVVARVTADTRLVSLMLANHETGAIQPVRHVAKTLPKTIPLHCDAAQAVGKLPVNFGDLGVTALTASAHKFHGPNGVGLLLLKKGAVFQPTVFGGHQQRGVRPGTEAVPLAVGLAVALRYAVAEMEANRKTWLELRETFLKHLGERYVLNGSPDGLPTTLNLSFPGCRAEVLLMALDLADVACSTGSACSSGSLLPSPVLASMGVPLEVLESAMRFSFHAGRTTGEMADAAKRVTECVRRTRG